MMIVAAPKGGRRYRPSTQNPTGHLLPVRLPFAKLAFQLYLPLPVVIWYFPSYYTADNRFAWRLRFRQARGRAWTKFWYLWSEGAPSSRRFVVRCDGLTVNQQSPIGELSGLYMTAWYT